MDLDWEKGFHGMRHCEGFEKRMLKIRDWMKSVEDVRDRRVVRERDDGE